MPAPRGSLDAHGRERLVDPSLEPRAAQAEVRRAEGHVVGTVGMKSWSSGSWKTMPTRRRTSSPGLR